ncbi:unnamed protein product [Cyprideis torosa]|uniref:Uncharacterized protein n=1 Tax=Cyprideis torosa TaxID=163714 RepID=A0A7R8WPU9_9CRUS|nr:unnamed protein product [Cyprideis torosa]CAG0907510.1 unnamed protein product [Cyprideis torosa]
MLTSRFLPHFSCGVLDQLGLRRSKKRQQDF